MEFFGIELVLQPMKKFARELILLRIFLYGFILVLEYVDQITSQRYVQQGGILISDRY